MMCNLRGKLSEDIDRASGRGKPTQTQFWDEKGVGQNHADINNIAGDINKVTQKHTPFPMTQTPFIQNSIQSPVTLNVLCSVRGQRCLIECSSPGMYGINTAS